MSLVQRIALSVLFLTIAVSDGQAQNDAPVVRTASGAVRGAVEPNGVVRFEGIPYAEQPIGVWRWRPAPPVEPWVGVRDATRPGPACPQPPEAIGFFRRVLVRRMAGDTASIGGPIDQSELCLRLNVWTPATQGTAPVIVWVHGGAGTSGSGSQKEYDGALLAAEGAVVVTINYRLGPLGFLAHPALSDESGARVSGNYALRDIVSALTWLRTNVAAFGGDPERITLAGQSAGATLIAHLLVSPDARGLFQRAILQSGSGYEGTPRLDRATGETPSAHSVGEAFAEAIGVTRLLTAKGRLLREYAPREILEASAELPPVINMPVIDGKFIEDAPIPGARKAVADVPVLLGANAFEFSVLMPPASGEETAAGFAATVRESYGAHADALLAHYEPIADTAPHAAEVRLYTDEVIAAPTRRLARALHDAGVPTYLYSFERAPDGERGAAIGAFHGLELFYLFGTFPDWWPVTDTDRALATALRRYWVSFAATGVPSATTGPEWPRFDESGRYLRLGDAISVGTGFGHAGFDVLDQMAKVK